jgi:hypothetical protein
LQKLGVVIWSILLFLKSRVKEEKFPELQRHKPLAAFGFNLSQGKEVPMPSHIAVSCPLLAVNCFTMNTLPIKSLHSIL